MFSCFKAPSDVAEDASLYPRVDDEASVKNLRGSGQSAKAPRLAVVGVESQPALEQKKRSWIKKLWSKMRTCLPLKKNKKASPAGADSGVVYPVVRSPSGGAGPRSSTAPGREVNYTQQDWFRSPAAPPSLPPRLLLSQKGKPPVAAPPRPPKMPAASSSVCTSPGDRTVTQAKAAIVLGLGRNVDAARALPHGSVDEIGNNMQTYAEAKTGGVQVFREHLQEIDFSIKNNADALRQLAVGGRLSGLQNPFPLEGRPELQQAAKEVWLDVRADSIMKTCSDKPLAKQLEAGTGRLKLLQFPSQKGMAKIAPRLIAEVACKVIDKSCDAARNSSSGSPLGLEAKEALAVENNFEAVTSNTPEWASSPEFKAAYWQQMSAALAGDGGLTLSELVGEFNNYDIVQPRILVAALETAGLAVPKSLATNPQLAQAAPPQPPADKAAAIQTRFDTLKAKTTARLGKQQMAQIPKSGCRFKDVLSPAASNVPIAGVANSLHANYVPVPGKTAAIATQYPPNNDAARGDFWRMALENKTGLIMDLTQPGSEQLQPYYPQTLDKPARYGDIMVTCTHLDAKGVSSYSITDTVTGKTSMLNRYHVSWWEDKTPLPTEQLAQLAFILGEKDYSTSSVTVHCRAGIGRTGTALVATMLRDLVKNNALQPDKVQETIDDLILKAREARGPKTVQTAGQRESLVQLAHYFLENGTG